MKLRNKILALTMLLAAGHSSALTLGRVRGAAVVGQSLDLSVQLQLGSDETANSLCLEADVFHADSRQDPNRVKIVVEMTQQASTVNARITSLASVDEPMVTIYVRAGCGQKISRRYVLLADFPSESATPVAPTVVPFVAIGSTAGAPSSGASVSPADVPPTGASGSAATAGDINKSDPWSLNAAPVARPTPAPKPAPRARQTDRPLGKPPRAAKPVLAEKPQVLPPVPVPVAAAAPAPAAVVAPAPVAPTPVAAAQAAARAPIAAPAASAPAKPAAPDKPAVAAKPVVPSEAGQSRLKLDPMTMLSERVASLESSTTAPAAEVSRDAQRVQSLEESVKTLVALATKNEASLQDMKVRLQRAEADRFPVQWLYGLGFLILACLGAIAYLWSRLRARVAAPLAKDDWWSSPKPAEAIAPAAPSVPAALRESLAAKEIDLPLQDAVPPPPAPRAKVPLPGTGVESRFSGPSDLNDDAISELDVSLVEMSESNFDQLMQSDKSHSALRRGPLSGQRPEQASTTKMQSLAPRTINSDQLFDVRQQADFFVSLGQTDQAIQILEKQINDHGETSPLIYLDLLQIFHSLNLKTDYRQFREDFNLLFNGRVPEFSMFTDEGRGLQDYPHVLAHITALWSTRKALMVIEASIFRDPLDERSSPFDLGAFRDLLLLHAIAQSFTVREDVTSDLAPLRANMGASLGTHSKGARLSASGSSGASGAGALTGLEPSGPSALAQLDISLSTGGGLHEAGSRAAALGKGVSAGAVAGAAIPSPAAAAVPPMAATHSELDLDLDLSDFAQLVPETKKSSGETSEFSKLLRAQGPSKATTPDSLDGAQKPAAPSSRAQAGSAGGAGASGVAGGAPAANASPAGADDNLLNFDLPPSTAKLNVVKPKR